MEKDPRDTYPINVINLRDKPLLEALFEVEKRPWLWLQNHDLPCLMSFVNGWVVGRNDAKDDKLLTAFDLFVAKELDEGSSTVGWCNMILKHFGEQDAIAAFFRLLRQFQIMQVTQARLQVGALNGT
ncbi:hypothetical protein HCH_03112 [Hahella chejuensis KCTC 2396]|uniref:Uncharacterized protein n=1 Tax=Hahella chejuensis (strain KCTC 2396) TaxID=349521 RepID=Q2SHJ7_HAHCH|nr:hypothetical protein [Hahella chejuensis]ABC29877.1 hypothetical protein HCH_03112 [Hahella chejuensis KCTC 2396]